MFNKKTMSLAVAAAATGLSLSAMAQINVSDGTGDVAIANESITATTTGLLAVQNTSNQLDVTGQIDVGIASTDPIYIRFDWTGATLAGPLNVTGLSIAGVTSSSLTDGLAGDSSAIFGVTPATGFNQTAPVALTVDTNGLLVSGDSVDVRMRIYESQVLAIAESDLTLSDQTSAGAVSLGDALSITFASVDATAEVTTNFLAFDDGAGGTTVSGQLGSATATFNSNFTLASGAPASFTGLVNVGSSSVTYSGDFSFATGGIGIATGGSCTGAITPLTVNTSTFDSVTTAVTTNGNQGVLCATVNGTTQEIPEGDYTATVALVHANLASSPSSTSATGDIGSIVRNGTTVEVAYITTFDDYRQRLIINSRHGVDAAYNITFGSEDGTTCTALPAASGTLVAGENLVLITTDIVEITGDTTRCSATVTVVAPEGNISVATTQVNTSDSSTDTVSYN